MWNVDKPPTTATVKDELPSMLRYGAPKFDDWVGSRSAVAVLQRNI
jgi:hypothetical protein